MKFPGECSVRREEGLRHITKGLAGRSSWGGAKTPRCGGDQGKAFSRMEQASVRCCRKQLKGLKNDHCNEQELVKDLEKGSGGSRSQIQCVNPQAGRGSFMKLGHERKERKGRQL